MGHSMKLELARVGLLVELANHYINRGATHIMNCMKSETVQETDMGRAIMFPVQLLRISSHRILQV